MVNITARAMVSLTARVGTEIITSTSSRSTRTRTVGSDI
jgi:hypothetical protein